MWTCFIPYHLLFNSSNSLCIHQNLFGFGCPGCGMTRATYLILHFQIKEAIAYNFAIIGLVPYLIFELVGNRGVIYKFFKGLFLGLLVIIYFYRLILNFNLL